MEYNTLIMENDLFCLKLNTERAYMPLNRLFNTVGGVIEPKQ